MVTNLLAPSPSRTICFARSTIIQFSAVRNSASAESRCETISSCLALPVANTNTVSLVEVSPSTVMELNERRFASSSSGCSTVAESAALVKTNASMVAMLGAIMPEPLAMPLMIISVSPICAVRVADLAKVSVVMIDLAAWSHELGASEPYRSAIASVILSSANGSPITPVEATNTSCCSQRTSFAAAATERSTDLVPAFPVKAFALPELTTSARACPLGNAPRHHSTGAAAVSERVITPATAVPLLNSTIIKSSRPKLFRPHDRVPMRTPGTSGSFANRLGASGDRLTTASFSFGIHDCSPNLIIGSGGSELAAVPRR